MVRKCREMRKDKEVKTLQNGGKQELQSCTDFTANHVMPHHAMSCGVMSCCVMSCIAV